MPKQAAEWKSGAVSTKRWRPTKTVKKKTETRKRPTLHAVGGAEGLMLRVSPTGAKSWIFRARQGGSAKAARTFAQAIGIGKQQAERLRWKDLDLDAKTCKVPGRKDPVPVDPILAALLEGLKARRRQSDDAPVFPPEPSQRRDIGLGSHPEVSLEDAREAAKAMREHIRAGRDPLQERAKDRLRATLERAKALTFDQVADQFMSEKKAPELRNQKHVAQWRATLRTYASPVLGRMPVAQVDTNAVLRVLQPIWKEKTETASRLRGRIEKVLGWAKTAKLREGDNPAAWKDNLEHLLPKPSLVAVEGHMRALPVDDVPGFFISLQGHHGIAPLALQFLTLTATRSGEVRGAIWDEIDREARMWTIPAERMKAGKPHRVPLSKQAIAILDKVPRFAESNLVFPGPKGEPLSNMGMLSVMRKMKVNAVPHGMRSSFRDWGAERTAYPRDVLEHALAHKLPDDTEAAYFRSDLFGKRKALMQEWADFCTTPKAQGDVIPMRRKSSKEA